MRTIPLTVLAYEGPSARAYLSRLRRVGLAPERILRMVLSHHPGTRRPVGRYLPGRLRASYAERSQEAALNYWPRRLRREHPRLVGAVAAEAGRACPEASAIVKELVGPFPYEEYAGRVERVFVRGLADPALTAACARLAPGAVLFTGGGILPEGLLRIPGLRFLHVHPGRLPEIRGADGLLWSTLLRGRPGISCFWMARGIDEGEIVAVEELPPLQFDIAGPPRPDDRTLYRAIFSFYDPLIRAEFLTRRVLSGGKDPLELPSKPQDPAAGRAYHFMHPLLRRRVFRRLFPSD